MNLSATARVKAVWAAIGALVGVVSILLTLITAATYLWRSWDWVWLLVADEVTISCPREIFYHEHTLFGTHSPPEARVVRLYVHPRDGARPRAYWLQRPITEPGGAWSFVAGFGNPFWHDMIGQPPLTYEVVAALFKREQDVVGTPSAPIEVAEGKDVSSVLKKSGATHVAKCEVVRRAEKGCTFLPRIVSPVPPGDPRTRPQVRRSITFSWEPDRPLWMELWRGGREVPAYPQGFRDNHVRASLEPGIYELKVKEVEESRCDASVWFEVTNSPERRQ